MLRRNLLKTTAYIPVGVAVSLAGCASVSQFVDKNLASVVADVQTVAAGIKAILPQVANLGVPTDVLSTVSGIVDDIESVALQVAGVYTESNAKPLVERLSALVVGLAGALAAVPGLPPIVLTIVAAAQVLVPAIEKVLGIVGVQAPKAGAQMSPDQARVVLRTYAAKR